MSYNRIIVVGNVGGEPETSFVSSGRQVTNFSVAVNYRSRRPADQGGAQQSSEAEETQWFRIVCWEPLAEPASQYATKGRKVLVEGRFRGNRYTANDGTERQSNEIIASRVVYLGGSGDQGPPSSPPPEAADPGPSVVEDLPF